MKFKLFLESNRPYPAVIHSAFNGNFRGMEGDNKDLEFQPYILAETDVNKLTPTEDPSTKDRATIEKYKQQYLKDPASIPPPLIYGGSHGVPLSIHDGHQSFRSKSSWII